jgi:L-rhamnose mutarotase
MERMAQVIRLRPAALEEYRRIHAAVWPEVLDLIAACGIRNYTIFLKEPELILFAYWEYHGTDFAADMAKMKADARMRDWWAITDPMQEPFETRSPGEWWARIEPVFHTD